MDEMKGEPYVALACSVREDVVSLLSYPDGSWGIRRGAGRATVWESSERLECYRTFCRMCELAEPLGLPMVELLVVAGGERWISASTPSLN